MLPLEFILYPLDCIAEIIFLPNSEVGILLGAIATTVCFFPGLDTCVGVVVVFAGVPPLTNIPAEF